MFVSGAGRSELLRLFLLLRQLDAYVCDLAVAVARFALRSANLGAQFLDLDFIGLSTKISKPI